MSFLCREIENGYCFWLSWKQPRDCFCYSICSYFQPLSCMSMRFNNHVDTYTLLQLILKSDNETLFWLKTGFFGWELALFCSGIFTVPSTNIKRTKITLGRVILHGQKFLQTGACLLGSNNVRRCQISSGQCLCVGNFSMRKWCLATITASDSWATSVTIFCMVAKYKWRSR